MSTGPRIPLPWALEAARVIAGLWGMKEPACVLVGSARRGRPDVGDLEFIAPHPGDGPDQLFDLMDKSMETGGLFGEGTMPIGRPRKGFKRGFFSCDVLVGLRIDRADGKPVELEIPVQLHRYEADGSNRGWKEIMCTGPTDFGRWFLWKWKEAQGIPLGDGGQASIDGHLVDRWRKPVRVLTEHEAFTKANLRWVAPAQRDTIAEEWTRRRERRRA